MIERVAEKAKGAGSGIYKMASSLGAALGVAISTGIFVGLSAVDAPNNILDNVLTFEGRQDNIAIRQAAIFSLLFSLLMVIIAIIAIMKTIPKGKREIAEE
ncbi:MAG TPA: hypothetical protein VL093_14270 [Flavipsychrobacter sp.]|nr:hypothetical protein [Flavipsychrobacter sp.]